MKIQTFSFGKCIQECRLQSGSHFVEAYIKYHYINHMHMCVYRHFYHDMDRYSSAIIEAHTFENKLE